MTRRVLVGLAASVLVVAADCAHRRPEPVEARCARSLNVEWSRAEGATERLDAFKACVKGAR